MQRQVTIAALVAWIAAAAIAAGYGLLLYAFRCLENCNDTLDRAARSDRWTASAESWQWVALWTVPGVCLTVAVTVLIRYLARHHEPPAWTVVFTAWLGLGWVVLLKSAS